MKRLPRPPRCLFASSVLSGSVIARRLASEQGLPRRAASHRTIGTQGHLGQPARQASASSAGASGSASGAPLAQQTEEPCHRARCKLA